jgi:arsenate reductase
MAFGILILCTGNSARSQIAEALIDTRGEGRVAVASAGSHPAERVNPFAVRVLQERGIDWQGRAPQSVHGLESDPWDLVITVCDNAREACPIFPHARASVHWGMPDPAEVAGSDREKLAAFEETLRALQGRVGALLALPLESMTDTDLATEVGAIGRRPW